MSEKIKAKSDPSPLHYDAINPSTLHFAKIKKEERAKKEKGERIKIKGER